MKNLLTPVFACFALLLFTACLATPYQKAGLRGGFTETRLAPDVFRVMFKGNAFTSMERAQEFTLLRVSELCFDSGYGYFAVGQEANRVTTQTIQTAPATSHTTGSSTGSEHGRFTASGPGVGYTGSSSSTYSSTTTHTPARFATLFRPNSFMLVRCFKQKPSDRNVFDAAFLINGLKTKYKIKD